MPPTYCTTLQSWRHFSHWVSQAFLVWDSHNLWENSSDLLFWRFWYLLNILFKCMFNFFLKQPRCTTSKYLCALVSGVTAEQFFNVLAMTQWYPAESPDALSCFPVALYCSISTNILSSTGLLVSFCQPHFTLFSMPFWYPFLQVNSKA